MLAATKKQKGAVPKNCAYLLHNPDPQCGRDLNIERDE